MLLALGAMFGELLASSGGAERVSYALLRAGGTRLVPWSIGVVAMLLGLAAVLRGGGGADDADCADRGRAAARAIPAA